MMAAMISGWFDRGGGGRVIYSDESGRPTEWLFES